MKSCLNCGSIIPACNKSYCSRKCSNVHKGAKYHYNSEGNLRCSVCELFKSPSRYHSDKRNRLRGFKANMCADCHYTKMKARIKNYGQDVMRCLNKLLKSCRYKDKYTNLNIEYLCNINQVQQGRCAISGIKMTYFVGEHGRVNTNCSVDRINNNKPHVKGNIQLVCFRVNIMKNNMLHEELLYYCNNIVTENEKFKNSNGIQRQQPVFEPAL